MYCVEVLWRRARDEGQRDGRTRGVCAYIRPARYMFSTTAWASHSKTNKSLPIEFRETMGRSRRNSTNASMHAGGNPSFPSSPFLKPCYNLGCLFSGPCGVCEYCRLSQGDPAPEHFALTSTYWLRPMSCGNLA